MSTNKTAFLNMHSWVPTDSFRRTEFNENFAILDDAIGRLSIKAATYVGRFNPVGNGIADDTAKIQSAFTEALANSGVIIFERGKTYRTTVTSGFLLTLTAVNYLQIVGNGATIEVLDQGFEFINCDHITVNGLRIKRTAQAQWSDVKSGISVRDSSNISVQWNEIWQFVDGISLTNCTNANLDDNELHHLAEEPLVVRKSKNVRMERNDCYQYLGDGILVKQSQNVTARENHLHDVVNKYGDVANVALHTVMTNGKTGAVPARGGGITCNSEGGEGATDNYTIDNNTLEGTGYGIIPIGVLHAKITRNKLTNITSASGIEISADATFNPNLNASYDIIIDDNTVDGLLHNFQVCGIYVKLSPQIPVDRAVVSNNFVYPKGALHRAITVNGDVTVSNNTVKDYYLGIDLENGAMGYGNNILEEYPGTTGRSLSVYDDSVATNNKIRSTRQVAVRGDNAILSNNRIKYTGTFWAVFLDSGAIANQITDNKITATNNQFVAGEDSDWETQNVYRGMIYRAGKARYIERGGVDRGPTSERPNGPEDGRVLSTWFYDETLKCWISYNRTDGVWNQRNVGTATHSGNGVQTDFLVAHGITGGVPIHHDASPASAAAGTAEIWYTYVNGTSLHVVFKTPPVAGSGNVVFTWEAELR